MPGHLREAPYGEPAPEVLLLDPADGADEVYFEGLVAQGRIVCLPAVDEPGEILVCP